MKNVCEKRGHNYRETRDGKHLYCKRCGLSFHHPAAPPVFISPGPWIGAPNTEPNPDWMTTTNDPNPQRWTLIAGRGYEPTSD